MSSSTTGKRLTRSASLLASIAMLLALLPAAPAAASHTFDRGIARACPEDAPNAFPDGGGVHGDSIDCLAFWEIVQGRGGQYHPREVVNRASMATFIVNQMETAGYQFDENPPDAFDDTDDTVHKDNIDKLANAGVVEGTGNRQYSPGRPVNRAAMATFINKAIGVVTGTQPSSDEDFFDDTSGTHEPNINALASIGVVTGTGHRTYSPGANVTRAPMASFIARGADYLAEFGHWPTFGDEQAYTVLPRSGTTLALGSAREYTVEIPTGTAVNVRLFPAIDLTFDGAAVTFRDANNDGEADENASDARIIAVDGRSVTPAQEVSAVVEGGTLTFVVQSTETANVFPVVWTDVESQGHTAGVIDLNEDGESNEPFGAGGAVTYVQNEAAEGTGTPTVQAAATDADLFAGTNNRTYNYDSGDQFSFKGTSVTMSEFESLLNAGDIIEVTYRPGGSSSFNMTHDEVHAPPAPIAVVGDHDADPNDTDRDDVLVHFTIPWNNSSATTYDLERQRTGLSCSASDPRSPDQQVVASNVTQADSPHLDPNLSDGCYRYRLIAKSPAYSDSSNVAGAYSSQVEVPGPETTRPTITDARATTDNGPDGSGDPDGVANRGDTHRLRFSEQMASSTADGYYRVSDADGTVVDIVCEGNEEFAANATCQLNSAPIVDSDRNVIRENQQLTVSITGSLRVVQAGDDGVLRYPVTIVAASTEIRDRAGNHVDVAGSPDRTIQVAS